MTVTLVLAVWDARMLGDVGAWSVQADKTAASSRSALRNSNLMVLLVFPF
ncbi:MAG TPA: hypothetical protein VK124_05165 [Gemmatimonadales bacterium]|nr:hypothetical protein [Gemmatimonadales bacterium]